MHLRLKSLPIFFLLLIFQCGLLRADYQQTDKILQNLIKNVRVETLPNGLTLILYKRGFAPVFAGVVTVRVGGVDEKVGETGISHMFEHMAFKGTPEIGSSDFQREKPLLSELETIMQREAQGEKLDEQSKQRLKQINAELDGLQSGSAFSKEFTKRGAVDLNATTGSELTTYFMQLPTSEFEFWCWLESERLFRPVMRQFYKERDVVLEEKRMRVDNDPEGKLYQSLLALSFMVHPYRNPVIGYEEDIRSLTASRVEAFRSKYYVPSNMVVSVAGDIDYDRDLETLKKYFGRLPTGPQPEHPQIAEPKQEGERRLVQKADSSPQLTIAYHKPQYPDADDAPFSLMLEAFAGSKTSPLYKEIVERAQIATDIGFFEAPGKAFPNLVVFFGSVKHPHSNLELMDAFDASLKTFLQQGVTQAELERIKRRTAMTYLNHLRSSRALAADFASSKLLYGDWQASFKWFEDAMRVQLPDMQRVAQKYLRVDNRSIAMLEHK